MQPAHLNYAVDVVEKKILTGELVRAQCEIVLKNHESPPAGWFFDEASAQAAIEFIKICPHVKGSNWTRLNRQTGERAKIVPPPWIEFFVAEVWGWWSDDGIGTRRYRNSYLQVGKKNAKSTISAALALHETINGDDGGEIIAAASKLDQTAHVWGTARDMVLAAPELQHAVGITGGSISCEFLGSSFYPISGSGKGLDGINPSFVVLDEAALIQDRTLVETLEDSFGARACGAMLRITTAQPFVQTIWREDRDRLKLKLKDQELASREFAMLYELDDEDDFNDQDVWIKANPGLGTIKSKAEMQDMYARASTPIKMNAFRLKQLNQYTDVQEFMWLEPEHWDALPEMREDGQEFLAPSEIPQISRVGAVDMSESQDLAAVCFRYELPGSEMAYLKFKCFACSASLDAVPARFRDEIEAIYRAAEDRGELVITKGNLVDYDAIEEYLRDEWKQFAWDMLGYDPFRQKSLFLRLENSNIPVMQVRDTQSYLHSAVTRTRANIMDRKYQLAHSPFIRWQLENCAGVENAREQTLVRHFQSQPWRKQDAITAMIMTEHVYDSGAVHAGESHFYVGDF